MSIFKKSLAFLSAGAVLCTGLILPGAATGTVAEAATASIESQVEVGTLGIGGGGFVSGIITGDDQMYARTDVGGAYRYDYETGDWVQLMDFLTEEDRGFLSIDAFCVDPNNDDTLYILAGCAYFSGARTAIFRSKDAGETFDVIDVTDLIQVHGNGYGRQCGEAIAVDPDNPDIIYCGGDATAGSSGLIMSEDGGDTWKAVEGYGELGLFTETINWPTWTTHQVKTTGDKYDGSSNGVATVMITGGKVYVGTSVTGVTNMHVADVGSDDFQPLHEDFPTAQMPARINLDADGNLLITTMTGVIFDRGPGNAFKYNVTTGELTDITPTDVSGNTVSAGYGGVFSDPKDSNKLVATTCAQWYSQSWSEDAWDREAIAWGDRFFKSTDGGATWREFTPGNKESWGGPLLGEYLQDGGRPWVRDKAIHWCGTIVIDPRNPDRILVTSGNGVFASDNVWDTCPQMYFEADGIEEVVCLDMVSIPGGNPVSVIGDYDGFIHTSKTESTQHMPSMNKLTDSTASTAGVAYCPADPKVMVRLAENFAKGYYTTDGGTTWTELPNVPLSGAKAAINQLEDGSYRIMLSDTGKVSYTDDFGATWKEASLSDSLSSDIWLCVDAENPQYVYAYGYYYNQYYFYSKPSATIDDARYILMVSDDYGATFSTKQTICQYDECDNAYRIAYLGEGEFVIAAGWYGAYHVTDYGKTVTKLDSVSYAKTMGYGAPEKEGGVNSLYLWGQPTSEDPIGVYLSTDAGQTWKAFNVSNTYGGPGNGNFLVGDMNTFGTVYMSTVGCGIVYMALDENAEPDPKPTTTTTKPATTTTTAATTTAKTTETTAKTTATTAKTTATTAATTTVSVSSSTTGSNDSGDVLYGDVNLDGSVSLLDAIFLNKYQAKALDLNDQQKANADCCADEIINSADLIALLKYIVRIVEELPVQP